MSTYNPNTIMEFGKFEGYALKDVPQVYLDILYHRMKEKSQHYKTTPYQRDFMEYYETYVK